MLTRVPCLVLSATIVCAAACAPYETQTVQNNPRPDPSRQAQAQHEQKPGDLTGEAKVSGNSVNVLVQKTTLCRDVTTTPMVADTTAKKKLTSVGRGTQYLLVGGAVVLAGVGAYMVGGPCKKTDTDAAGKDVERDCTSQEAKDQKNGGVGLGGVPSSASEKAGSSRSVTRMDCVGASVMIKDLDAATRAHGRPVASTATSTASAGDWS